MDGKSVRVKWWQGLAFTVLVLSCAARAQALTLKVGLYPYVPRLNQFKTVITREWQKAQPNVPLVWADDWDGGYDRILIHRTTCSCSTL